MASGIVEILIAAWVLLQVTKGGLVGRLL